MSLSLSLRHLWHYYSGRSVVGASTKRAGYCDSVNGRDIVTAWMETQCRDFQNSGMERIKISLRKWNVCRVVVFFIIITVYIVMRNIASLRDVAFSKFSCDVLCRVKNTCLTLGNKTTSKPQIPSVTLCWKLLTKKKSILGSTKIWEVNWFPKDTLTREANI